MAKQSISLSSSNLESATYDEESEVLTITFKRGHTYTYDGVPSDIFEGLASAPSPGRYFNQSIRDQYG